MPSIVSRLAALEHRLAALCKDASHPPQIVTLRGDEPEPPPCPTCGARAGHVIRIRRIDTKERNSTDEQAEV